MLDAEKGILVDPTADRFFNDLDLELFKYHATYKPFIQADVIYYRPDE